MMMKKKNMKRQCRKRMVYNMGPFMNDVHFERGRGGGIWPNVTFDDRGLGNWKNREHHLWMSVWYKYEAKSGIFDVHCCSKFLDLPGNFRVTRYPDFKVENLAFYGHNTDEFARELSTHNMFIVLKIYTNSLCRNRQPFTVNCHNFDDNCRFPPLRRRKLIEIVLMWNINQLKLNKWLCIYTVFKGKQREIRLKYLLPVWL